MGMNRLGAFVLGVVVGGVAVSVVRSAAFKKACSKVVGAGLQLKDEAAAFMETVKEDAQDIIAEARHNKAAAEGAQA